MKTTLVILIMAALCLPSPSYLVHAEGSALFSSVSFPYDNYSAMLIGAGTLKAKNGNCFTVRSDDGNDYFAEVIGSYIVGDYVYHSNPINGWVEILGHAD